MSRALMNIPPPQWPPPLTACTGRPSSRIHELSYPVQRHVGNGTNVVYVDPEHDLVIVARWIANPAVDGLVQRVLASIRTR